jgi:hypothetical protein
MSEQAERGTGRPQAEWDVHYEQGDVEAMPWFFEALDHDVERSLG